VYTALARHGATVPAGSCPSVGAGGLALGGGMGLAGRDRGLTCDNVVALHVVTADGTERVCDAHSERDLYWACRGGGGSFGVATRFRVRLHAARSAAFFTCSWPAWMAAEALAAWQAWAPHTDPRATSVFTLGAGGSVAAIGQYRGSAAALRALSRPLARVPGARLLVGTSGYLALMRRWAGCLHLPADACHTVGTEPGGQLLRARFAAASLYVARPLSASGRAAIVALARRAPPSSALLLDAHGGAINRVRPDATAFVHRRALYSVQILTYYSAGAEAAHLRWVRDAKRTLGPRANGQAYQNYADPDLQTWRRAYYGDNYDRLAAIKARVDPGGLFDFHQAIGT
jgi:FAD/FMN-containing dehydrogenase